MLYTVKKFKKKLKFFLRKSKFLSELEIIIYFKYHKLRFAHCIRLIINLYFKKEIYISFQSGFGDMLMCYPYFRKAKEKYPKHKIFAVIHHPKFCRFKEMAHCGESYLTHDGKKIDYLYEFIKHNPYLDGIIYDDCWNDGYIYGYPKLLENEFGFAFNKTSFLKDKDFIFTKKDSTIIKDFINKNKLDTCISVAIHFKTANDKINDILLMMFNDLATSDLDIKFVLFGNIPQNTKSLFKNYDNKYIDMSNCYSKSINTRQLIGIASACSIFIGGRGGFNGIYYLLDIPTINIFDDQGLQEIENGLWTKNLWEENEIGNLFFEDTPTEVIFKKFKESVLSRSLSK